MKIHCLNWKEEQRTCVQRLLQLYGRTSLSSEQFLRAKVLKLGAEPVSNWYELHTDTHAHTELQIFNEATGLVSFRCFRPKLKCPLIAEKSNSANCKLQNLFPAAGAAETSQSLEYLICAATFTRGLIGLWNAVQIDCGGFKLHWWRFIQYSRA